MLDLQRFRKGKEIDMIDSFKKYCNANKINYSSFDSKIEEINK